MKRWLMIVAAVAIAGCTQKQVDFASIEKIDAHIHIRYNGPEVAQQAAADNFTLLSIIVSNYDIPWQQTFIARQRELAPECFKYLTSFPLEGWDEPDWQEKTIEHLRREFANGALGVKFWKNIGMEFRDKDGDLISLDDPKFDPIIDFIHAQGKTMTGHIGEPLDCWLPLEDMIVNRRYYENNPQYHMYLHPEFPSYEDHIESVKNMLAKHPGLRYVGCHMASIEWSVAELAKFLDAYPNVAVDMAARINDWQHLDREAVRDFIIAYQDRLMYATDMGIREGDDPERFVQRAHERWLADWQWFATDSLLALRGHDQPLQGLGLPQKVLKKIYAENAREWYPGL